MEYLMVGILPIMAMISITVSVLSYAWVMILCKRGQPLEKTTIPLVIGFISMIVSLVVLVELK